LVFEEATRLQYLQVAHVSTVPFWSDPNFVQIKSSCRGAARAIAYRGAKGADGLTGRVVDTSPLVSIVSISC
jgi:hypothetical protein